MLTPNGNYVDLGRGCYQFTASAMASQKTSVWYNIQIALNNPFDYTFYIYHEASPIGNWGADGVAFVLQRDPAGLFAIGEAGHALGFAHDAILAGGGGNPISPSFAIELDIWDSSPTVPNDIVADHISMIGNGDIDVLINPPAVSALPFGGNVTVGQCRPFRIKWIPTVDSIYVWYNNSQRLATQFDIRTLFGVNDTVWVGMTGSSGAVPIQQVICFDIPQLNTTDTIICSGANVVLNPSGGISWTWTPSASLSCGYCPSPIFFNPAAGNYNFAVLDTGAVGCPIQDTLRVTVEQSPSSDAGPDRGMCVGDSVQIGIPGSPGLTYSWFPNTWISNSSISQPTVSPPSTTVYLVTVVDTGTVQNCSSMDLITITMDSINTPPFAGPDTPLCDTIYFASASAPFGGEIATWSVISGAGTFSNINSPTTTISGLSPGMNSFTWSFSNGSCTISDTISIVASIPLGAFAGQDSSICVDQFFLNASVPGIGENGFWTTLTPGVGFSNAASETSLAFNLQPGSNLLEWTVTNGICTDSDTINLFFATSITVNAGPDTSICGSNFILDGSPPGFGETGTWSSSSPSVVISNPNLPNSSVSNLPNGFTLFYWNVTNGTCNFLDSVLVATSFVVSANAGPDTSTCFDTLSLNADTLLAGSGNWAAISPPGLVFSNPASPNTVLSNLQPGLNTVTWTVTNFSCVDVDTLNILIVQPGPVYAGADTSICDTSVVLFAQSPTLGNGLWSNSSGVVFANPADSFTVASNLATGPNYLIWTVSLGGCSLLDSITINSFPVPSQPNAGPDQTIFNNSSTTLAAIAPLVGFASWSAINPGTTFVNFFDPNTIVNGLSPGFNFLVWGIGSGPCPLVFDTVIVEYIENTYPTGFSPNGDGNNDFFEIPNLANVGPVVLEAFNRWGNEVYSSDNYQNDWGGTNSTGNPLADDTYFVILTFPVLQSYKGYVVIRR